MFLVSIADNETLSDAAQYHLAATPTYDLLTLALDFDQANHYWTPLHALREVLHRPGPHPHFDQTFRQIVTTPRRLGDFYTLYGVDTPLSATLKRAVAQLFRTFTPLQISQAPANLRTLMRKTHPRPAHPLQSQLWKRFLEQGVAA